MRRRTPRPALALLLLLLATPRLLAQSAPVRVDLDAGSAWLRQTGIPQSIAGAAGATITHVTDRTAVSATMLGACGAQGSCALQGVAGAGLFSPAENFWRWDLALTASNLAYDRAIPSTGIVASGRLYVGSVARSVYVGAGIGAVRRSARGRGLTLGETGGWWLTRAGRWSIDARVVRVPTIASLDSIAFGVAGAAGRTPTFADLSAGWSLDADNGRVALSATAGGRTMVSGARVPRTGWGSAVATTWITPHVGIVIAAGRALEDLTRGAPASRYVSLSLRVRLHGSASWMPRTTFPATDPVAVAIVSGSGTKMVQVRVAGASRVELMADFTDWTPRALVRTGDGWDYTAAIPAGPHRIAVRVDGGPWIVPANLPTVHDEFGGSFGLITVP